MNPDAEYTAERICRACKLKTTLHIRLEEWVLLVTCPKCKATYELDRY
jgi:hypothetical protein